MGRARQQSKTQVTLFPFLTVLLCAMGALIFLFMIITQQIRSDSLAAQINESQSETVEQEEPISENAAESVETIEQAEVVEEELEPEAEPIDPNQEWRERLAKLQTEWQKDLALKQQSDEQVKELQKQIAELEGEQKKLLLEKADLQTDQKMGSREADELRKQTEELKAAITTLVLRTEEAREKARTASSQYAIIPYDGQLGTIRRPILIECRRDSIRFMPENIVLTADDMNGFGPEENPLAAGTEALIRFWNRQSTKGELRGGEPGSEEEDLGEPYVLIIVRPEGAMTYYAAQRFLSQVETQIGYELLTQSYQLKWPELNLSAQQVCEAAVEEAKQQQKQSPTWEESLLTDNPSSSTQGTGGDREGTQERKMRFDPLTGQFIEVAPPDQRGFEDSPFNPDRFSQPQQTAQNERGKGKKTGSGQSEGQERGEENGRAEAVDSGSNTNDFTSRQRPRLANLPNGQPQQRFSAMKERAGQISRSGESNGSEEINPEENFSGFLPEDEEAFSDFARKSSQLEQNLMAGKPVGEGRTGAESFGDLGEEENEGAFTTESTPWYLQPNAASENRAGGKGGGTAGQSRGGRSEEQQLNPPISTPRRRMKLEKELKVVVTANKLRIGSEHEVSYSAETSNEKIYEQFRTEVAEVVQGWGESSESFYWRPYLKFVVHPGGSVPLQQLLQQLPLDELNYEITFELGDAAEVVPLGELVTPSGEVISIKNEESLKD